MKRRLLNLLIVLSLPLLLASLAGWGRSHWAGDEWQRRYVSIENETCWVSDYGFAHGSGEFALYWSRLGIQLRGGGGDRPPSEKWFHREFDPVPVCHSRYPLGQRTYLSRYGWHHYDLQIPDQWHARRALALPYWAIVLPSAIAPAWWALGLRRRRAARRSKAGRCPTCGYDLRATPDRCPECGAEAMPQSAQGAAA